MSARTLCERSLCVSELRVAIHSISLFIFYFIFLLLFIIFVSFLLLCVLCSRARTVFALVPCSSFCCARAVLVLCKLMIQIIQT